jgi:hypothetical protein
MQALANVVQRVGPYLMVALVMPGGVFVALGMYLYRRQRDADGAPEDGAAPPVR